MPSRVIVSIGAWNGLAVDTSRKSASQPPGIVEVGPPGLVTETSESEPGVRDGVEIRRRVEPIALPETETPPTVTDAPGRNWLPTSTTAEPPAAGPDVTDAYES